MREKCACFRRRTFTIFKDLLWYVKLAEAMDRRDVVPLREKGGSEATKGVCKRTVLLGAKRGYMVFLNDEDMRVDWDSSQTSCNILGI